MSQSQDDGFDEAGEDNLSYQANSDNNFVDVQHDIDSQNGCENENENRCACSTTSTASDFQWTPSLSPSQGELRPETQNGYHSGSRDANLSLNRFSTSSNYIHDGDNKHVSKYENKCKKSSQNCDGYSCRECDKTEREPRDDMEQYFRNNAHMLDNLDLNRTGEVSVEGNDVQRELSPLPRNSICSIRQSEASKNDTDEDEGLSDCVYLPATDFGPLPLHLAMANLQNSSNLSNANESDDQVEDFIDADIPKKSFGLFTYAGSSDSSLDEPDSNLEPSDECEHCMNRQSEEQEQARSRYTSKPQPLALHHTHNLGGTAGTKSLKDKKSFVNKQNHSPISRRNNVREREHRQPHSSEESDDFNNGLEPQALINAMEQNAMVLNLEDEDRDSLLDGEINERNLDADPDSPSNFPGHVSPIGSDFNDQDSGNENGDENLDSVNEEGDENGSHNQSMESIEGACGGGDAHRLNIDDMDNSILDYAAPKLFNSDWYVNDDYYQDPGFQVPIQYCPHKLLRYEGEEVNTAELRRLRRQFDYFWYICRKKDEEWKKHKEEDRQKDQQEKDKLKACANVIGSPLGGDSASSSECEPMDPFHPNFQSRADSPRVTNQETNNLNMEILPSVEPLSDFDDELFNVSRQTSTSNFDQDENNFQDPNEGAHGSRSMPVNAWLQEGPPLPPRDLRSLSPEGGRFTPPRNSPNTPYPRRLEDLEDFDLVLPPRRYCNTAPIGFRHCFMQDAHLQARSQTWPRPNEEGFQNALVQHNGSGDNERALGQVLGSSPPRPAWSSFSTDESPMSPHRSMAFQVIPPPQDEQNQNEHIYEDLDSLHAGRKTGDTNVTSLEDDLASNDSQESETLDLMPEEYKEPRAPAHPPLPRRRRPSVEKTMIWTEYGAYLNQVKQIGVSACGVTAVINVLKAMKIPHDVSTICSVIKTNLRAEKAPVPQYLLSRCIAGTTAEQLSNGVSILTNGETVSRFFPTYPPRDFDIRKWLTPWIKKGAIPLVTLNLQRGVPTGCIMPDAWHHQMVYGVGPKGVYLTNPLELIPADVIYQQLTSDSVLLVRRGDIVSRWNEDCDLRIMIQQTDARWRHMNVMGQVINIMRENATQRISGFRPRLTSHITIPAWYKAGITIFVKKDSDAHQDLLEAPELPHKEDT